MENKPDKKNKFHQFCEYIKRNKDLFPFLEVIITFFGFIIIIFQLFEFINQNSQLKIQTNALIEQNKTLNKSLIQSYRPIGYVGSERFEPYRENGNFDFIYKSQLINRGNGPLIYIGFIYYVSDKEINFKQLLLAQKNLVNYQFDYNYRRTRKTSLLKDDSTSINCRLSK